MRQLSVGVALTVGLGIAVSAISPSRSQAPQPAASGQIAAERHLKNIRQLTEGGENAEAYFSPDGTRLIYQSTRPDYPCDQIYSMKIDGTDKHRVSTGTGRTTCGFFYPGGQHILFASTHEASAACPPKPSYDKGYVWPIYPGYDIYRAEPDGSKLTPLTRTPGYDAEATIAPDGLIVFTSVRDGDMEIYSMKSDGSDVRRLTTRPGPDGGPFFSWDGKLVAFRGRPLPPGPELDDYRALLKEGLWRPTELELFVMDSRWKESAPADEAGRRQLRSVVAPGREAADLRVEHPRPEEAELRRLSDQPRWLRPRTRHVQRDVRRLSHVFSGRQASGVRVQPQRQGGR